MEYAKSGPVPDNGALQAFNVICVLGAFKRGPPATAEMMAETKRLPTVDLDRGVPNPISQL